MESAAKIRRLYFVQEQWFRQWGHFSIKALVRKTGLSRNTIREVTRSDTAHRQYTRTHQPMPKLSTFVTQLEDLVIGNGDVHLKNWSLIYPDMRTAALSPAYDLVSTIPYIEGENTAALNYSRTKKMAQFNTDELRHLAAKALLPEKFVIDTAKETVRRFKEVWAMEKNNLPLAAKVLKMIEAHAPTIPLYEELA